ncbi:MAG: hypothetical protein ACLFTK_06555 [Anaerolineales bacterium]
MKLSTQIGAFIVLLIALALGFLYVDDITIETDVRTRADTLVPLSYAWDGQGGVTGLTVRYPRGWQIQEDLNTVRLVRPEDTNDADNRRNVVLVFDVLRGEDATDPLPDDLLPAEAEALNLDSGQPAARAVTPAEDGVNVQQIMRLTEGADGAFLRISSAAFIPQGEWDETVQDDLDRISEALVVADDFAFEPPLFDFSLPEEWSIAERGAFRYVFITPPEAAQPQGLLQLVVIPADVAVSIYNQLMYIPGDVEPAEAETPIDLLETAYADGEGDDQVSVTNPLRDVNYAGLPGRAVTVTGQGIGDLHNIALEAEDDFFIIATAQVVDPAGYAAYADGVEALLNSLSYRIPDDAVYDDIRPAAAPDAPDTAPDDETDIAPEDADADENGDDSAADDTQGDE